MDILCKVVDNYGDAGVGFRLARALSSLDDPPRIRLICDDLHLLSLLAPGIDPLAPIQDCFGWTIIRWDGGGRMDLDPIVAQEYADRPVRVVIENLACGRPDWLENILFDSGRQSTIVDLEHLTAEAFAKELHAMPSLTRSPLVRKWMFFPGFEPGTGGLILDPEFLEALNLSKTQAGRLELKEGIASELKLGSSAASAFWFPLFCYERDFHRVVRDCARFHSAQKPLLVFAAAGKSQKPFRDAWEGQGKPFEMVCLPFLPQKTWDRVLLASDFSLIRGEDSLSRACLSSRPFLWQAYPQEGRQQLVKLEAFHELLGRQGVSIHMEALFACNRALNDRDADSPSCRGSESLLPCLQSVEALAPSFQSLSASLLSLGDLSAALMTFLREKV